LTVRLRATSAEGAKAIRSKDGGGGGGLNGLGLDAEDFAGAARHALAGED
jgi:hypothetical protein